MNREHEKELKEQFKKQAGGFSNALLTLNQENLLTWIVDSLDLDQDMSVLDVAGGTGILSRAIAPSVHQVTAVDISEDMMAEGLKQAAQEGVANVDFQLAYAEDLPFEQASFDLVVSRLAFHHFTNPTRILKEMSRVCDRNGKIAVIDLMSPENEEWSRLYNHYERLRDPSHVHAFKKSQLVELFKATGLEISHMEVVEVPVHLERWLALTKTNEQVKEKIIRDIKEEMETGTLKTGLSPYMENGDMMFRQRWVKVIGEKTASPS